jgi:hypothetical protein
MLIKQKNFIFFQKKCNKKIIYDKLIITEAYLILWTNTDAAAEVEGI